jgi:2-(1,2-epoxy-1,2-dihydrophenyl)acetyl-CoA isomerase
MPADHPTVLVDQSAELTVVTLNRPDALNALNVQLLTELVAALEAHRDSGTPVLLIRGSGRAFCVGEDLKETLAPRTGTAEELRVAFELLQDVTRLMVSIPGPTIASVRGFAIGGGAEIALAADFVVVEAGTRVRFPEVPIGHAHTGGITLRLPAMVGLLRAKELLLTGRWVESDECLAIGLATQVADDAEAAARELAERLAGQPSRSMAAAKRALELSVFPQQESNLRIEVESALYCFAAPEATDTFEQFRGTKTVAGAR